MHRAQDKKVVKFHDEHEPIANRFAQQGEGLGGDGEGNLKEENR